MKFILFTPPILAFFLGIFSVLLRSDLSIPPSIGSFLSLYLLFSIGFQGGRALQEFASIEVLFFALGVILISTIITSYVFYFLRAKLSLSDAAATAASYGSIGAITFITARNMLQVSGTPFNNYTIIAMPLMEITAIIMGIILFHHSAKNKQKTNLKEIAHAAFCNGPFLILAGAVCIGFLTDTESALRLEPFTNGIFQGLLSFFMLDLGIIVAERLNVITTSHKWLIYVALVLPIMNATAAIMGGYFFNFSAATTFLLTSLCASASYTAVPAAMKSAIPKANPSLYVSMALGITLPFNLIIGLPLYFYVIGLLW